MYIQTCPVHCSLVEEGWLVKRWLRNVTDLPDQSLFNGTEGSVSTLSSNPSSWTYPLVNCHITMESHHFQWENPLFLWSFSIAMLVITRPGIWITHFPAKNKWISHCHICCKAITMLRNYLYKKDSAVFNSCCQAATHSFDYSSTYQQLKIQIFWSSCWCDGSKGFLWMIFFGLWRKHFFPSSNGRQGNRTCRVFPDGEMDWGMLMLVLVTRRFRSLQAESRICHSICAMTETMTETSTQVVVFLYSHEWGSKSLRFKYLI